MVWSLCVVKLGILGINKAIKKLTTKIVGNAKHISKLITNIYTGYKRYKKITKYRKNMNEYKKSIREKCGWEL